MVLFCSAHAQLDDSFDEEYEVANYNLAQSAELEAARVHSATVQQHQYYEQQQQQQPQMSMQAPIQQVQMQQNYPLQPQSYSYGYTAHKQMLPLTNSHHSSSDAMQIDNLVSANMNINMNMNMNMNNGFQPSNNSRKLKRSCEFECDSPATDASGSKRVKQIAF
ncbi:hypothetical protein TWF106_002271 [Orbilia oligospora]|uniref:Uncharacterized protein n=1 Tax=Orbilia oligospora TaxID=2813651 RepID=A0A6G1LZY2_ORBOL|nr:hypothetical protein TWF788_008004 [Orbilia oligospora]KAF3201369.1 hypothetical protein TWF191_003428 [Orbilia oligospora]KAF3202823.1 hypothetical protein TWF106_002271 [Orbilia oligospora]KAF3218900.1 hypothetical protein TWF679_000312 [Orbilia oligospora]KAF3237783.1 hypothetical protein TWF192_010786 [Orbilia oligospora]